MIKPDVVFSLGMRMKVTPIILIIFIFLISTRYAIMIPRNILIHKIFSLPFCKKEEKHKKILTNVRVGAIMSSVKAMTERVHL